MNLNKHIKLKEQPRFTEEEEKLFNSLLAQVESNSAGGAAAAKTVNPWKIWAPAIAFVCVIAVVLTCVFTLRPSGEFKYNDENIKLENTVFTEMRNDVLCFDFNIIEPTVEQIQIAYDTVSNDKLYYACKADYDLSIIEVVVVINEKYNYNFELYDNANSIILTDYTLNYSSKSSRGEPQINYRGWIKVETEIVYFDYVQIPDLGDEAFFESIQQIIQLKK